MQDGFEFLPTEIYPRTATTIQPSSDSLDMSLITSSTSERISEFLLLTIGFFFAFFFAASALVISYLEDFLCMKDKLTLNCKMLSCLAFFTDP
jgi:hypothetical protein